MMLFICLNVCFSVVFGLFRSVVFFSIFRVRCVFKCEFIVVLLCLLYIVSINVFIFLFNIVYY